MFKNQKLFGSNIVPACGYCLHKRESPNDMALCLKFGIVSPSHHCKYFKYDPLKRVPRKTNLNLPKFSPDDFKL